jgi:hypothetical protein
MAPKGGKTHAKACFGRFERGSSAAKVRECMPSTTKAQSTILAHLVRLARRARRSYDACSYICQRARKPLGLTTPQRARTLPPLLPADELTRFFRAVRNGGHVPHEIMLQR